VNAVTNWVPTPFDGGSVGLVTTPKVELVTTAPEIIVPLSFRARLFHTINRARRAKITTSAVTTANTIATDPPPPPLPLSPLAPWEGRVGATDDATGAVGEADVGAEGAAD
jgi:hypothetical protein